MARFEITQGNVRLKISANPGVIADVAYRAGIQKIFEDELLNCAAELERESPRGATGQLASSWQVTIPRREPSGFTISASIYNTSDNAIFRIAGRGPGLFPPLAPIQQWVETKIESDPLLSRRIAFLIARKIATVGTQRYRDRINVAGINRDGTLQPNSPIRRAEERIVRRIQRL
jgi:hypothetical protein